MYNIREQERLHQQRRVAARLARQASTANKNQVCRQASTQAEKKVNCGVVFIAFVALKTVPISTQDVRPSVLVTGRL